VGAALHAPHADVLLTKENATWSEGQLLTGCKHNPCFRPREHLEDVGNLLLRPTQRTSQVARWCMFWTLAAALPPPPPPSPDASLPCYAATHRAWIHGLQASLLVE
jgi:hypothetical protein